MQIEATGKSVELAIQNGLLECGMRREDVDVKVIDNGGLFKKAKVILTWGEGKKDETPLEEPKPNEEREEQPVDTTTSSDEVESKTEEVKVEKKKRIVDTTRLEEKGKEFLLGLAKLIDENAIVDCVANENELSFSIKGEKLGKLIGFHGENIQALQMLLSGLKLRHEGPVRM